MKKLAVIVLVLAVLVVSLFLLYKRPTSVVFSNDAVIAAGIDALNYIDLALSFSKTGHFYTEGITVEITASNPNARIFYSTDGSLPTTYSTEYVVPVNFELSESIYAVVLKAIAVYGDFATRPLTHTFFIGEEIHQRFGGDILVFSLSTNPDYLFGHDNGILVEGRLREDFIRDNPGLDMKNHYPANFNLRGWKGERPIHVETFNSCGERILAQAAGVRVHGNWSRGLPQKSLRLIARRWYTPDAGRFQADLFPNDVGHDGSPLTRNDSLTLRNGGNSFRRCMLRNELGIALAREIGLMAMPFRGAAVFINGEYYGFSWLQVHISEQYLEDFFNAPTREFDIVSGGEQEFKIGHRNIDARAIADLEFKNSFAYKNLQDDAIFAELEAIVDIDDLLMYYAFQIYWNNCDWPNNNLRRWRYTGEQTPGMAPELDGRWRYAVHDLDLGLGAHFLRVGPRLLLIMLDDDEPRSPFLKNILSRPDMADRFTMILCDIAANVINEQIISDNIDATFNEDIWYEVGHWAALRDIDMEHIRRHHRRMIDFAAHRHEYIFGGLSEYFGFGMEMYTVNVIGGEAIIGTLRGTSSRYFNHLVVPVSPVLPEFTEFCHWILNGEQIYEMDITVSLSDANDDVVELELITRPAVPPLVIAEAYAITHGNGLVLVNLTGEAISTDGLYLSNNSNDLFRWSLPSMTVAPGGTLELAGRGSRASDDLFRVQMDFNVRSGRSLFLSDEEGNILDTFALRAEGRDVRDLSNFIYGEGGGQDAV